MKRWTLAALVTPITLVAGASLTALAGGFVPAALPAADAFSMGGAAVAVTLQSDLAVAQSYASQIGHLDTAWGTAGTAGAAGALLGQLQAWQPDPLFDALKTDDTAEIASLISTGAIPAAAAAEAANDLATLQTRVAALTERYSIVTLVTLAEQAGFSPQTAVTAAAVAMAESHGDPLAIHINSNRSTDYGLWQINWPTHYGVNGVTNPETLYIPSVNAAAAWTISDHGTDWRPWSTYEQGLEIPYLAEAAVAAGVG